MSRKQKSHLNLSWLVILVLIVVISPIFKDKKEQATTQVGLPSATQSVRVTAAPRSTATARPTATPDPDPDFLPLSRGSSGDAVAKAQRRLNELGYNCGTADGKFGALTESAVWAYQSQAFLNGTGVIDSDTWYDLFSADAPHAPKPSIKTAAADSVPSSGSSNKSSGSSSGSTTAYIGNRNSKVFHRPSCSSVDQMKSSNKVPFSSRDAAVNAGYRPCQRCNP